MVANIPPILLVSIGRGRGSGAERVLEYLLIGGRKRFANYLVVAAPIDSAVLSTAEQLGYRTISLHAGGSSSFRADGLAAGRALPMIRALRPSLIHSWHTRSFEIVAALSSLLRTSCSGTLHDHPESIGYSHLRHKLIRWGANRMDRVACVSQTLLDACHSVGWETPIHLIRNGLPHAPLATISASRGGLRVGFLGCSEKWKGASLVLQLARNGLPSVSSWNLYGEITPSSHPSLVSEPLNLGPAVTYHGSRPIEQILEDCDVILHPSERFDPYPTVLLESARGGRPVLAARVGGTAEIVVDGKTGFLFETGDHVRVTALLAELADNYILRQQLGQAARARFENQFTVASMVDAYADFWEGPATKDARWQR